MRQLIPLALSVNTVAVMWLAGRLASERDSQRLIAQGVDPSELEIPLRPRDVS